MAVFEFTPDFGATKSQKPNVSVIKFGDGYESRMAKGLNSNPQTWSLQFTQREAVEASEIDDFLKARNGVEAFDWTPPDAEDAIRVKCESWDKRIERGGRYSVNCVFVEVFEPSL